MNSGGRIGRNTRRVYAATQDLTFVRSLRSSSKVWEFQLPPQLGKPTGRMETLRSRDGCGRGALRRSSKTTPSGRRISTSAPLPSLARHEHTTVVLVSVGSHLCSGYWEGVFHSPHPSHHPLITLLRNRPLLEKGPSNVDCNCFATVTRGSSSATTTIGSGDVSWIALVLRAGPS